MTAPLRIGDRVRWTQGAGRPTGRVAALGFVVGGRWVTWTGEGPRPLGVPTDVTVELCDEWGDRRLVDLVPDALERVELDEVAG